MQLGHLLTRSGLAYPEVSSMVYHDSFCQLGSSVSLLWVIYFEAFYLYVVFSLSCIPVICPKLVLFLTPFHLYFVIKPQCTVQKPLQNNKHFVCHGIVNGLPVGRPRNRGSIAGRCKKFFSSIERLDLIWSSHGPPS